MKVSKNQNFKNIKLKTVYVEIERLKWSDVMKKRFWKKHRLLRPCVSRICRQLLNIELQKRKNRAKSFSKERNSNPLNKKGVVENTKYTYRKQGFARDDVLTKEPPRKKLKFCNGDCSDSDSGSESLKEKPPDTKNKSLKSTDSPQKTEDSQVNGNGGIVSATKNNSAKPSETNLLTLYTKSGVKVLSMKSVTVAVPKVSNISSLQKGIRREQSLVKSSSVEPLSNNCDLNKTDRTENLCSADYDNRLEGAIESKKSVEVAKEKILNEDIDDIDIIKNVEKLKNETGPLEQSQSGVKKEILNEDNDDIDNIKTKPLEQLDDLKNQESETDSGKESVSEVDKNESNKGSDIDRTESDKESINEDDKDEIAEESIAEEDRNETDVESVNEADRNEIDEESVNEVASDDFDKASISEDNRIDDEDDDNTQSCSTSDTESLPEIDPSFDPVKFLDCTIKTDDDGGDPENENKKVPFIKSQNFQLNCDTMVMIKPLLPESITPKFCFRKRLIYSNAFRLRKELMMMTFMGQYGVKNHYVHPSENNACQEDYEDTRPLPLVDPFTHSVFASIIKRDRMKDKANKGFLRKFRSSLSKYTNQHLGSQSNSDMRDSSTDAYNYEKPFSRPFVSSKNPIPTYQSNMGNIPPNAVIVNSNTIKIGNNFFSRVFDNNKPTQMFRPMNTHENPVLAPQPRISRITMCLPNAISSNNTSVTSSRYIYTASPSNGMPLLIPVVQSQSPNNSIPVQTSIPNSQYSKVIPTGNTIPPDSSLSNISKPHHMNFGDSIAPRPMPFIPLNTYNQTGPGLINDTNSSTYPPILNGNYQNSEVIPCHLSSTNPECNTVNNNNSNGVPTLPNFSVPCLTNQSTAAATTNIPGLSQQHNQMTSMTFSDKVSNLGDNCNDEYKRKSVIVNRTVHPPLPLPLHPSSTATLQNDGMQTNRCESTSFFQWLHDMKTIGSRCGSGCSLGSNTIFFNIYAKYVQMFIANGFPNSFSSVMNAIYQLLIADNDYCSFHAQLVMNDPKYHENIQTLCNLSKEGESNRTFFLLQLPYVSPLISNPTVLSSTNLFILKRFVFVVEKKTRTVLYPLPAPCKFQENDTFDKITVVILMSPRFGLGPGLVIFPRSILGGDMLLSLGLNGPLFETWTVSAHQKGGLTQSMMTEFLNGQCRSWILRRKINPDTSLAIDWWWSLENQLVDNIYNTVNYFPLHKMFPIGKDPFDIAISVYMERLWGLIVKAWSDFQGNQKLQEHHFPKFIYGVFNKLCDPHRLLCWCRESGLYPYNPNIKNDFLARVCNLVE